MADGVASNADAGIVSSVEPEDACSLVKRVVHGRGGSGCTSGIGCRGGSGCSVCGRIGCLGGYHIGIFLNGLEATNVGVPASVELAALDVVAQRDDVTHLKGVLVGAVPEEVKLHLAGIAVQRLQHIFLLLPVVAGLGHALLQLHLLDNLTFNVHIYLRCRLMGYLLSSAMALMMACT